MAPASRGLNRFYLLLGVIAIAGAALLYYLVRRPAAVSIPANVAVLAADTAGFRGYVLGSESAPVEITEYADFECPACGDFASVQFPDVRERLIATGRVRWRFRDFPLSQHRNARVAAHAAACANDQGKYWEMHDAIFAGQGQWSLERNAAPTYRRYAGTLGLDQAAFDECMQSARYAGRIQASVEEGVRLGVGSTPTFLIDGRLYPGVMPSDSIRAIVDRLSAPAGTAPVQ